MTGFDKLTESYTETEHVSRKDLTPLFKWVEQSRGSVRPGINKNLRTADSSLNQVYNEFANLLVLFVVFLDENENEMIDSNIRSQLNIFLSQIEKNIEPYIENPSDFAQLIMDANRALSNAKNKLIGYNKKESQKIQQAMNEAMQRIAKSMRFEGEMNTALANDGTFTFENVNIITASDGRISDINVQDYLSFASPNFSAEYLLISRFLQVWTHLSEKEKEEIGSFDAILCDAQKLGKLIEQFGNLSNDIGTFIRELFGEKSFSNLITLQLLQGGNSGITIPDIKNGEIIHELTQDNNYVNLAKILSKRFKKSFLQLENSEEEPDPQITSPKINAILEFLNDDYLRSLQEKLNGIRSEIDTLLEGDNLKKVFKIDEWKENIENILKQYVMMTGKI